VSVLDDAEKAFVIQAIRRADRDNNGMTIADVVAAIQRIVESHGKTCTYQQGRNAYRGAKAMHKGVVTGLVVAQPTTSKRSAITVDQQYRWHVLLDEIYNEMIISNTSLEEDPMILSQFMQIMPHFVLNSDEECIMGNAANLKILGDYEKKKHEKTTDDSRISVTLHHTGNSAGATGPTAVLLKGDKLRQGYNDAFLVKHGCAPGSCLEMTPSAFMTGDAWANISPKILKGIRQMPVICDHPLMWCMLSVDGFGCHCNDVKVMQLYRDSNIHLIKEEGDSSHVNQAFDRLVAKQGKAMARYMLSLFRNNTQVSRGLPDQYGVLVCAVAAVREMAKEPDIWINSFKMVNMHPSHRLPFLEWIQKIDGALQGGIGYVAEETTAKTRFDLLPTFWRGMEPDERRKVRCQDFKISRFQCLTCLVSLLGDVYCGETQRKMAQGVCSRASYRGYGDVR